MIGKPTNLNPLTLDLGGQEKATETDGRAWMISKESKFGAYFHHKHAMAKAKKGTATV